MARRLTNAHRGSYGRKGGHYLLFVASVLCASAISAALYLAIPSRIPQTAATPDIERPKYRAAAIQLPPDKSGLCPTMLFENRTGRFQFADTKGCLDTGNTEKPSISRGEAVARAFK